MTVAPGQVARIIDGDTFALYHVGTPAEERIRLLGVDTPERGQPQFLAASSFTAEWLTRGPWVLTTCKRDSFGRLLGSATRNGASLKDDLLASGLATERPE